MSVYCQYCDIEMERITYVLGDAVTGYGYECPKCNHEINEGDLL